MLSLCVGDLVRPQWDWGGDKHASECREGSALHSWFSGVTLELCVRCVMTPDSLKKQKCVWCQNCVRWRRRVWCVWWQWFVRCVRWYRCVTSDLHRSMCPHNKQDVGFATRFFCATVLHEFAACFCYMSVAACFCQTFLLQTYIAICCCWIFFLRIFCSGLLSPISAKYILLYAAATLFCFVDFASCFCYVSLLWYFSHAAAASFCHMDSAVCVWSLSLLSQSAIRLCCIFVSNRLCCTILNHFSPPNGFGYNFCFLFCSTGCSAQFLRN